MHLLIFEIILCVRRLMSNTPDDQIFVFSLDRSRRGTTGQPIYYLGQIILRLISRWRVLWYQFFIQLLICQLIHFALT